MNKTAVVWWKRDNDAINIDKVHEHHVLFLKAKDKSVDNRQRLSQGRENFLTSHDVDLIGSSGWTKSFPSILCIQMSETLVPHAKFPRDGWPCQTERK
jgi:folate-dependent phosphoribosylglycinamide formyltransferase PurN